MYFEFDKGKDITVNNTPMYPRTDYFRTYSEYWPKKRELAGWQVRGDRRDALDFLPDIIAGIEIKIVLHPGRRSFNAYLKYGPGDYQRLPNGLVRSLYVANVISLPEWLSLTLYPTINKEVAKELLRRLKTEKHVRAILE